MDSLYNGFEGFLENVVTVAPDISLAEAVFKMSNGQTSCLVAIDGERPIGIITARDVLNLASRNLDFNTSSIRDVMRPPVCMAIGELNTFEAYQALSANKTRYIIATGDNGSVKGIVSNSDILNNLNLEFGEARRISRVMSTPVHTVQKDASLLEALEVIIRKSIGCVVVEEERRPIGIVTENDITSMIDRMKNLEEIKVFDVMGKYPAIIDEMTPVHEAARIMSLKGHSHLIVVDERGLISGLISQKDIVNGLLEGKYVESLMEAVREKERLLKRTEQTLIEKTLFLDSILYSGMEIGIVALNLDYTISYLNLTAENIFGISSREAAGKTIQESGIADIFGEISFEQVVKQAWGKGEYTGMNEYPINGEKKIFELRVSPLKDTWDVKQELKGFMIMVKDVTNQRIEERTLRENEFKYRSIFENSRDVVYITSKEGMILDINSAGEELFKYPKEELLNMNVVSFYANAEERDNFVKMTLENKYVKDYQLDLKDRSGNHIHTLVTAAVQRNIEGEIIGFHGIIRDVTDQKRHEEKISYMAYHDSLTGLPNRRTFHDRFELELAHSKRNKTTGAILFMDLDSFKGVNDKYGHDVGDILLKEVATRIKSCLREDDSVSRLGGDEFIVLLSKIERIGDEKHVAEKLVKAVKNPYAVNGYQLQVGLSIGISIFPWDGDKPEFLIKRADDAMYEAKKSGGNTYKIAKRQSGKK